MHTGVIGLCTAYSLLRNTRKADLKVVLIERNESIPATANGSGAATGAGLSVLVTGIISMDGSVYIPRV